MTNAKNESLTALGFLAVSATAASRMRTFPISPGFNKTGAEGELQAHLARDGDWQGYALAIDGKGKLRLKGVRAKA